MATNHVPARIQHLVLLGRMVDVQTGRSERRLLHDDLLVLAGEFVAGEDFMIHRVGPENQILEDVQGMRMFDRGLQDFPVTSIELAALNPDQFGIAPADESSTTTLLGITISVVMIYLRSEPSIPADPMCGCDLQSVVSGLRMNGDT